MAPVSPSFLIAALLVPVASSFNPTSEATRRHSVDSQPLFSSLPLRPSEPLIVPVERKKVQVVETPKEPATEEEPQSLPGTFLSGITAVNVLLLGSMLLFSTLAPTPPAEDSQAPTPNQERVREVETMNQQLYEENLAAEQMTFVNGADFF